MAVMASGRPALVLAPPEQLHPLHTRGALSVELARRTGTLHGTVEINGQACGSKLLA